MDIKRLVLTLSVSLGLFLAWQLTLNYLYRAHPDWAVATTQPVEEPAATQPTATSGTSPAVEATATGATRPAAGLRADPAAKVEVAVIGSGKTRDPNYPIQLTIDPQGAGLSSVLLNDFFETANDKQPYTFQQPVNGHEAETRPLATQQVVIDDKPVDLSSVVWTRQAVSANAATYVATVVDDGKPVLSITKTFTLLPRGADAAKGFDVPVTQLFRNLTNRPIKLRVTTNGPTMPTRENLRSDDRRYVAGFDDGDRVVRNASTFASELSNAKPAKDMVKLEPTLPILWVAACNSYFDAVVRPDGAGDAKAASPVKIAVADAVGYDADVVDSSVSIQSNMFDVPAGGSVPFDLHAFFGPKQRGLLKDGGVYYAAFPLRYDETLVYVSRFCGLLTFNWLIDVLYWILAAFHFLLRDWGLAIIGLVCLVRGLLHPITKRAQVNMMQMGQMGPEVERLKKKYGDDKDGLNKAMMQMYKEKGAAPILGCLPMFLQMPIWLALWSALSSTFELRQAPFLQFGRLHLTWINDLSKPDQLINFGHTIYPLSFLGFTFISFSALNVMPLMLAGAYFVTQLLQPAPANMTPEQEQTRKMTRYTSLLVPVFFYSGPSGLTLYMLCSSVIGMVEAKIIRDHVKERTEAMKAGQILIDAPAPPKNPGGKKTPRIGGPGGKYASAKPQPTGWLATRVAKFQVWVDQIQRDQDRRKKRGT